MAYRIVWDGKLGANRLVKVRRKYRPPPYRPKLSPHYPALKTKLERIWQRPGVLHPSHITIWNGSYGYAVVDPYTPLWFWDWNATGPLYHAEGRQGFKGDAARQRLLRRIRPTGFG